MRGRNGGRKEREGGRRGREEGEGEGRESGSIVKNIVTPLYQEGGGWEGLRGGQEGLRGG